MLNDFITDREAFRKSLDLDDFVEEARQIVKDYKCPFCEGIYLNPVVDSCGHVFCKRCINHFIETHDKCPYSGWKLEEKNIQKIVLIGDILEKQTVFCKNRHFHCEWLGKLSELDAHLNLDCRRQVVKCPHNGCENSVFREDLDDHTSACEWRIVACSDCHILTPYIEVKNHQDVCPRFKVCCPQNCGHHIERQEVDNHIQDICFNTIISCPYKEIGCFSKVTKKELNDYMTINTNRHNLMLISHFKGFSNEVMNRSINFYSPHITNLEERLRNLENTTALLQSQVKEIESLLQFSKVKEVSPSKEKTNRSFSKGKTDDDKYMQRKRHRPDEEDPLKISKENIINLNELTPIDIGQSPFSADYANTCQSTLSPINSPTFLIEKIETTFDTINISKGLTVNVNKVALTSTGKLEHKYAFFNHVLNDRTSEWKVTLNISSNWAAVGVCCKEAVINNKFKFITSNASFNNATFAISTNGYSWNCNVPIEHNANIPNYTPIVKGEVIHFKYNSDSKELSYNIGTKLHGKLTSVYALKGLHLVPCVIFLHSGDEMICDLV
jgi:ribosomal protein L35